MLKKKYKIKMKDKSILNSSPEKEKKGVVNYYKYQAFGIEEKEIKGGPRRCKYFHNFNRAEKIKKKSVWNWE